MCILFIFFSWQRKSMVLLIPKTKKNVNIPVYFLSSLILCWMILSLRLWMSCWTTWRPQVLTFPEWRLYLDQGRYDSQDSCYFNHRCDSENRCHSQDRLWCLRTGMILKIGTSMALRTPVIFRLGVSATDKECTSVNALKKKKYARIKNTGHNKYAQKCVYYCKEIKQNQCLAKACYLWCDHNAKNFEVLHYNHF